MGTHAFRNRDRARFREVYVLLAMLILIASTSIFTAEAFLANPTRNFRCGQNVPIAPPLYSENVPSEDGAEESPLDAMRRMLEASWDAEKMGRVPMDSAAGAMECVQAIMACAMRQKEETGLFFVDLHLPAYDISQGERLYDEVMATEFCVELSNGLEGKSEILVRDKKTLDTVQKILTAREEAAADFEDEEDDDLEEEDDDEDEIIADNSQPDTDDEEEDISLDEDVDSFRQKLMSGWDVTDDDPRRNIGESTSSTSPTARDETEKKAKAPRSNKTYRLASMLGSSRIGGGGEMPIDVVRAVGENALAMEDEQNIIILSPVGDDEMVAVRALAEKYRASKKIILVNCQFTKMPRELQSAETVYSILPLVVKEKDTGRDLNARIDDESPTKVVVLRRYPKDWEIFVDIGGGFELVETVKVTETTRRGIPTEKVTDSLTRFLESI